jgi:DNA-binding CsgD family transcriptional regulator
VKTSTENGKALMGRGPNIDREEFRKLLESGATRKDIARQMGMHIDTVSKLKSAMLGRNGKPKLTLDQIRRMEILTEEGMPSTWVAEDLGCNRSTVTVLTPFGKHNSREWLIVWQKIRQSDELLALHRQFAP